MPSCVCTPPRPTMRHTRVGRRQPHAKQLLCNHACIARLVEMEKEPQLDVLRACGQEKKRVRERGCGTETMAAQASRRVRL